MLLSILFKCPNLINRLSSIASIMLWWTFIISHEYIRAWYKYILCGNNYIRTNYDVNGLLACIYGGIYQLEYPNLNILICIPWKLKIEDLLEIEIANLYLQNCFFKSIITPWLKVFQNRILRRIFGLTRDKNAELRRLQNEELHSLYHSSNIVKVIRSRRKRWVGHVARMEEGRSAPKILTG